MNQEQQQAIEKTAAALRQVVAEIEAKPETTRNRYGEYMSLLHQLNKYKRAPKFWAAVLVTAGANRQGVEDAAGLI